MGIPTTKTPTRIKWLILSVTQKKDHHEIIIKAKEPNSAPCSIGGVRHYSTESSEWIDSTFFGNVLIYQNIRLSPRYKEIKILWDSPADYRIITAYPNQQLEITVYDEVTSGGTADSKTVYTDIDFTLPEISDKRIIRPKSNTETMEFQYFTPVPIRNCYLNYRLEIDTAETFDSSSGQPAYSFSTIDDTSRWEFYSRASSSWVDFPDGGHAVDNTIKGEQVRFTDSVISSLSTGEYFFRIQPLPNQFFAIITNPTNGTTYIGNTITISGTVTSLNEYD